MKKIACLSLTLGFLSPMTQLMAAPSPGLMCPTVYQPARCSYEGYSAEGSNACFARIALDQILRMHDVEVDPKGIRCERTDLALAAWSASDPDVIQDWEQLDTDSGENRRDID